MMEKVIAILIVVCIVVPAIILPASWVGYKVFQSGNGGYWGYVASYMAATFIVMGIKQIEKTFQDS